MTGQQDVTMSGALVVHLNTGQSEAIRPDNHQPTVPGTPSSSEDAAAENSLGEPTIRKCQTPGSLLPI